MYKEDLSGSEWGPVAGFCDHGNCNKPSGCKKYIEIFDQLSDFQLLKTDSAPWRKLIISR
jgi:hypothetical protein